MAAVAAGVDLLGENRVQEARDKWGERPPVPLHLIGHLQTNKVKYATDMFEGIQSLDSVHLAAALDRRLTEPYPVFVEVNVGGEASKSGFAVGDVQGFLEEAFRFSQLKFAGMMAVLPARIDKSLREEQRIRQHMQEMVDLWRICRREGLPWAPLDDLSMGMSGDWEWAVDKGATMIRLGTSIFGPRSQT